MSLGNSLISTPLCLSWGSPDAAGPLAPRAGGPTGARQGFLPVLRTPGSGGRVTREHRPWGRGCQGPFLWDRNLCLPLGAACVTGAPVCRLCGGSSPSHRSLLFPGHSHPTPEGAHSSREYNQQRHHPVLHHGEWVRRTLGCCAQGYLPQGCPFSAALVPSGQPGFGLCIGLSGSHLLLTSGTCQRLHVEHFRQLVLWPPRRLPPPAPRIWPVLPA